LSGFVSLLLELDLTKKNMAGFFLGQF
jgi:hypothetical protein